MQYIPQLDTILFSAVFLVVGIAVGWWAKRPSGETADSVARFEGVMGSWRRITKAAEGTLLDNVAATTPWLAPAIPAQMAYRNVHDYLGFDPVWSFLTGLVIEFLGLAAVHTTFQLWEFNEERKAGESEAPVRWAMLAGGAYIAIVLLVNVILELGVPGGTILAKALLSLLSIVGAFVLALRSQHSRRLAEREHETEKRREANELGRLRTAVEKLKQQLEAAKQSRPELEQEVKTLKQEVVSLKQRGGWLETALKRAEDEKQALKQAVEDGETAAKQVKLHVEGRLADAKRLETFWSLLPGDIRAAIVKKVEGGTVRELAETFGTSPAAISRKTKELFGESGTE